MLAKYLIELIVFLLGSFFNIVSSVLPDVDSITYLSQAINSLLGVGSQTQNFLYFIFGDFLYVAGVMLPTLIILKFAIVPVMSFVRKIFVWGGS